jgi:hypothetical protein
VPFATNNEIEQTFGSTGVRHVYRPLRLAAIRSNAYHGPQNRQQLYIGIAVDDSLTKDEFEALAQINGAKKGERVSACVARNTKRLSGLKYIKHEKNGQLALTEKGQQTLFVKRCIDGLRAVANDALTPLDAGVALFLSKKGHIAPRAPSEGFDITQRGRETLADIDSERS